MNKTELLKKLDNDFEIYKYQDVWGKFHDHIKNIEQYIQPTFQKYSCGLMIDFSSDVSEIITTTFITDNLFRYIEENNKKDLLIFTHHPFYQNPLDNSWHDAISRNISIIQSNKVAIYVCHMALDFHAEHSTAMYLAKELISKFEGRLSYPYNGVDGNVECEYYGNCVDELFGKISEMSSRVVFYQFNDIKPQKVCCSPGGGNMIELIKMAKDRGVDTYITGVSEFKGKNSISRNKAYFSELHDIGINIIGIGHYETECLAMKGLAISYFKKIISQISYFEDGFYR